MEDDRIIVVMNDEDYKKLGVNAIERKALEEAITKVNKAKGISPEAYIEKWWNKFVANYYN